MMDVLADLGTFAVPILALVGLIVLAGLVVWLGRRARRNRGHGLVAGHRLAVIDHIQIDDTRRLVLIQRDDVQHLVVLGGGSDFLVESGIGAIHARAPQHPHAPPRGPELPRGPEPMRAPEPAPPHDSLRAAEPLRTEPLRAEPLRAEPLRAAEPHRPDPLRAELPRGEFHRADPLREPPRSPRDLPPLPPAAPRPPRPTPLPPEARTPVEPRPTMVSRGPARDIAVESAALAPAPMATAPIVAAAPFARRSAEPRVQGPDEVGRGPAPSPQLPHAPLAGPVVQRAEPVVAPPSEPETGARVSVKVDPLFAGMADHLEEALRRPALPEGEAGRQPGSVIQPSAITSPAFERALERAIDRPAAPVRGTEGRRQEGPAWSPESPAAAPTPVVVASPPAAAPAPAAPVPQSGPPGIERPEAGLRDAPSPEIRVDAKPAEGAPPIRAIDMFAPAIDLPAAADDAQPAEPTDLFEEEMANLLGRNRRP